MGTRSPLTERPFSNAANLSAQQSTPSIFHGGSWLHLLDRVGSGPSRRVRSAPPAFSHEPFVKLHALESADAYPSIAIDFIRSLVFTLDCAGRGQAARRTAVRDDRALLSRLLPEMREQRNVPSTTYFRTLICRAVAGSAWLRKKEREQEADFRG